MRTSKTILVLLIAAIIVGFALYIHAVRPQSNPIPKTAQTSPVFSEVSKNLTEANWTAPAISSEQTTYGNLSGQAITGQIFSEEASVMDISPAYLAKLGFSKDNNLAASGPGSNMWGYKKTENGKSQVIVFSYKTQPTSSNPNEPLQFDCPCSIDLKVFVSEPFDEK